MPNSHLHTAISSPRFSRYLAACNGNKTKALKLYRANLLLSQKMYAVISVFEVILRNSIDRHFKAIKGNEWVAEAVEPGGYFEQSPGCEYPFHLIQEAIYKLDLDYSHDQLIARLTFGFWLHQFAKKEFQASGSTLLAVFPKRPLNTNQKAIFKDLQKINHIRNRIAHHEPICFNKSGAISINFSKSRYHLILQLLSWLGCNPQKILYGIDGVPNALDTINSSAPSPSPSQYPTAP